jgi:hypothetical protein
MPRPKVGVYQTVAHGSHQVPWHLRVRSLAIFRDMARGFADDGACVCRGVRAPGHPLPQHQGTRNRDPAG